MSKYTIRKEKDKVRKRVARPVVYDDKKRPVYGFNDNGIPVCYAKKRNGIKGRCMNVIRFENGRCKFHGGKSQSGLAHSSVKTSFYEGKLPKTLGKQLADVINDPDYISNKHELGLNTLQIGEILEGLADGQNVDTMTWKEVLRLSEKAEQIIFDTGVQEFITEYGTPSNKLLRLADIVEQLVLRCKKGVNRKRLWKEINEAGEYRRKLAETEIKYSLLAKNNMPAEQVVALMRQIVGLVLGIWSDDTARLKMFSKGLDECSLNTALDTGTNPLQTKLSPSALIHPESKLTEDIKKNIAEKDVIIVEEISVEDEQGEYGKSDFSKQGSNTRKVQMPSTVKNRKIKRRFKI